MIYSIAFFVPLIYVFLRVFQQRNVTKDQELLMIITSYGITAFEILSITLIVSKGWALYLPLATGGAVGCILASRVHKKYFSTGRYSTAATHYHPVTNMYYRSSPTGYQFISKQSRSLKRIWINSGMTSGFILIEDK